MECLGDGGFGEIVSAGMEFEEEEDVAPFLKGNNFKV